MEEMACSPGMIDCIHSLVGNRMVDMAQVGQAETHALLQTELVETYYALQLANKILEVKEQTYQSLQQHYDHALKLEANGLITKAERLFLHLQYLVGQLEGIIRFYEFRL